MCQTGTCLTTDFWFYHRFITHYSQVKFQSEGQRWKIYWILANKVVCVLLWWWQWWWSKHKSCFMVIKAKDHSINGFVIWPSIPHLFGFYSSTYILVSVCYKFCLENINTRETKKNKWMELFLVIFILIASFNFSGVYSSKMKNYLVKCFICHWIEA